MLLTGDPKEQISVSVFPSLPLSAISGEIGASDPPTSGFLKFSGLKLSFLGPLQIDPHGGKPETVPFPYA